MSISVDLLKELENSTFVSNGTQVVNINGPRGFTTTTEARATSLVYTDDRRIVFNSIGYDNAKFNLSDQVKLNASGYLIIEPVAYTRNIQLFVQILTGGMSQPNLTYLSCYCMIPASESAENAAYSMVLATVQHTQTGALGKTRATLQFTLPKNAYDFAISLGVSSGNTSLYRVKIHGILSA